MAASRGFLIYAHNNEQIDYGLIALCNALMIKSNLSVNQVALVTDPGTIGWLRSSQGDALVERAFDHIIVRDWADVTTSSGERRFNDTLSTSHVLPWFNVGRKDAYALTPFDETVLIDCDYLVCERSLDAVWGQHHDLAINRVTKTLDHVLPGAVTDRWLDPFSIPLYWATCVFFRKGREAEHLFDLVAQVKEHYRYYRMLYRFPGDTYRNDYAFSIAVHMLNGFLPVADIPPLPNPQLLSCWDTDELIDVPARNEFLFLVQEPQDRWRFQASRTKGLNVHVMNKFSIIRQAPKLLALYGGV